MNAIGEGRPRIGVIGTGRMGIALGRALQQRGYRVLYGSRHPQAARERLGGIAVHDWDTVSREAEVVILALTWDATALLPSIAHSLKGKVVLSCTNPETGGGLRIAAGSSATEAIARALPDACVVAGFNQLYADLLEDPVRFDCGAPTLFLCSDDANARDVVARIGADLGLDPVDAGGLDRAGLLESLAALMVTLVRERGMPPASVAIRLMSRSEERVR